MQIDGEWLLCPDGVERPVLLGELCAADASWVKAPLLLDTGADRTVLCATVLTALQLPPSDPEHRIGGLGGVVSSVLVETQLRLNHKNGGKVLFRGEFAATTELETLDMSVLGRDITRLFAIGAGLGPCKPCCRDDRQWYRIEHD